MGERSLAPMRSEARGGTASSPGRLLVGFALLVMGAGLVWGLVYVAFGEIGAALPPLAFAGIVALSLALYRWHRRYALLRDNILVLMIPLPLLVQVALGGFASSGAVVMWSVIAVFGALVLAGARAAAIWLAVFLVELALAALIDPMLSHSNQLPAEVVTAFFALNIGALSAIALAILATFLVQRDRAMALLAAEQERSESLLLNVLPKEIAPRLKAGESPIADAYPEATVLFADIVGFTGLSERLDADEMVAVLNEVFCRFDLLAEKHGVEKIRTMGDNYMCVAGVPRPRPDHAQAVARLALDMRSFLSELHGRGDGRIEMRIGINSGPCVGGVIGLRKFVFDIWGDPVNTASRMESHGAAGRIQIAEPTYLLLRNEFDCEPRGTIDVKGKGPMATWFLLSEVNPS